VDISQPAIVEALRGCGDYVAIIGRPVDLLIRTGSVYWTGEVKSAGKNQKREMPAQIKHRDDARAHQAPHWILIDVDRALYIRHIIFKQWIAA
jgi:hypothetical protein